jgi:hypothetical protein
MIKVKLTSRKSQVTEASPASLLMQDLVRLTDAHPVLDMRVWRDRVWLEVGIQAPDCVKLHGIYAMYRRQGHGGDALHWLCCLADRHGVAVKLDAAPFTKADMNKIELRRWYRLFGFTFNRYFEGVRAPA